MTNGQREDVTTTEIMEFLKEHMVTKSEALTKQDAEQFATKQDLAKLKLDLTDFIDEKLIDLRGDIVALMRKEDHKLLALVGKLAKKNVLSPEDVREILTMEPFPKLVVS